MKHLKLIKKFSILQSCDDEKLYFDNGNKTLPLGGASNWNDLKDRPFYEETEVFNEPLNITWDGNTDSLLEVALPTPEATNLGVRNVYKMSDVVLSDEHLKSVSIRAPRAVNLGDIWDTLLGQGYIVSSQSATIVTVPRENVVVVAVREDNYTYDADITINKGLYFSRYSTQQYISSFVTAEPVEQTRTTLKKLDKKFLPDSIGDNGGCIYAHLFFNGQDFSCSMTYDEITAVADALVEGKVKQFALLFDCKTWGYDHCNDGRHRFSGVNYYNDTDLVAYTFFIGMDNSVEMVERFFDLSKIFVEY